MFDRVEAFYRPGSIPEALRLFQTGNGAARFLAGGTDLINQADPTVRSLIDLHLLGLSYVRKSDEGWVIGAMTTLSELEDSPAARGTPGGILLKAAALSGPVQLRNMATVGGRLVNGSDYAEIASVLLALDASVCIAHSRRRLKAPLGDFFSTHGKMLLHGTLLVEIAIPHAPTGGRTGWSFQKLGRVAGDLSLVNVAAGFQVDRKGNCKWARVVVGGVSPAPVRVVGAESLMIGRTVDATLMDVASDAVAAAVSPVSGVRGSAEYLREMCGVMTRRALAECAKEAGCA